MKRCNPCLLAAATLLAVSAAGAATPPRDANRPSYRVPRLAGIRIDANAADWGEAGFAIEALADVDAPMPEPNDLDVRIRLGWDKQGLLVLARVRDDRLVEADRNDRLWSKDGLELYLAAEPDRRNVIQAVIAPGADPNQPKLRWHVHDHRRDKKLKAVPAFIQAGGVATEDGYLIEARLPWANLAIDPNDGQVGFQVFVNDADDRDAGYRETYHAIWYPRYGAFYIPDAMYGLELTGPEEASPPVRATARAGLGEADGVRVRLAGPANLAGQTVTLTHRGQAMGSTELTRTDGRATGELLVRLQPGQPAPKDVAVQLGDRPLTRLDQPILPPPAPAKYPQLLGARIPRTTTLLATSNARRRNPVHILLYGQSIVAGDWDRMLEADLRERFPHADLTFENRAIGGFEAHNLLRTLRHDVYPVYPDLVIFHVYAGEEDRKLERILAGIRRHTTAELLVFTHQAPLPNKGFDASSDFMRRLAQEYNCELAEVREQWRAYLDQCEIEPAVLLGGPNDVHPNRAGNRLLADLVGRHIRYNPDAPAGWTDTVRTYLAADALEPVNPASPGPLRFTGRPWQVNTARADRGRDLAAVVGNDPNSALKLRFRGNRVDVEAGLAPGPLGTARVLIDGVPPSEHPGCYAIGRPSKVTGSRWPGIRRVGHREKLVEETWTLEVLSIDRSAKKFTYRVSGSVTGADGEGSSEGVFVSDSGRVVLHPKDFVFAAAKRHTGGRPHTGMKITWKVVAQCTDTYRPEAAPEGGKQRQAFGAAVQRTTLVQGLSNGPHTLEIIPNGDGPVPIEALVVHEPPLGRTAE